jgi:SnoaL-like domain
LVEQQALKNKQDGGVMNKKNTAIQMLGLALCVLMAWGSAVSADEITAKTLVERQQIQDLITRYYNNFGRENAENFADFYAEDAELILGTRSFKGRDGILSAYGRGPAQANQPPRPPRPERYSFIVTIDNPLIVVHGKTGTAQLVFTEYVIEKQGEAPKLITQGKEYGTFVKVKGQWRYKTRQIKGGTEPPEGWKE